ncbi:Zn-dependent hydrolase, partial [Achromobacter xylosoxidans]
RAGRNAQRQPIATGSHCDTVMSGGRFDGIIGVLAGIEVAHTMREHGIELEHPFEVIDFLSEEPSDYGISCVGSRALSGQ